MATLEPSNIDIEQTSPLLSIAIWRVDIDLTPWRFSFGINDDIESILNLRPVIGLDLLPMRKKWVHII